MRLGKIETKKSCFVRALGVGRVGGASGCETGFVGSLSRYVILHDAYILH